MAELDTIELTNPSSEDFTWYYNREPYTIKAKETKTFSRYVAFHLAKHLSTSIIQGKEKAKMTKKQREDRTDSIHGKISQLGIYDTHERRMALYDMLKNVDYVKEVCRIYPFKGFIGNMALYEDYVKESQKPKKEEESESKIET